MGAISAIWPSTGSKPSVALAILSLSLLCFLLSPPRGECAERPFSQRFVANAQGDIHVVGNTLLSASGTYVNIDGPPRINSSSADLSLPSGSTVLWAGLYWGGNRPNNDTTYPNIKMKTPASGGYINLVAQANDLDAPPNQSNAYLCFTDVTGYVRSGGAGTYTVADVVVNPNGYAGWGLIVVFESPAMPLRNLAVFDGFTYINNSSGITINLSGFTTPLNGPVGTTVGFLAGNGGTSNDSLTLSGTPLQDSLRAATNFFSSKATNLGMELPRNPALSSLAGWDVGRVNASGILGNNVNSASLQFGGPDKYLPYAFSFATDIHVPIININKTVADVDGGYLLPGDVLRFTISMVNDGLDTATNTVLTDNIPLYTTYKPGSLQILTGANAGAKSDGGGDDQAEYIATGTPRVAYRLGQGASAVAGGNLPPDASTSLSFDVTINPDIPSGATIHNTAQISHSGQTFAASSFSSITNPVDVLVMTPPMVAMSFSPNPVDLGGLSTMTITLTNPTTNVTGITGVSFNDVYPAGMVNGASPNPTISCTPGSVPGAITGGVAGSSSIGMTGGTIGQNGSCSITVQVTGTQEGSFSNATGPVTTSNAGTSPGATATFSVGKAFIDAAFLPAAIPQGETSTLTYTLTNPTAVQLTGAAFSTLLSGMQIAASGSAGGTCAGTAGNSFNAGQTDLSFAGLTVNPASSCTVTVPVSSNTPGYLPNVASGITSNETATGPPSNTAYLTVLAPVTVTQSFAPSSIRPAGDVSRLSITIANPNAANPAGNATITGVQFSETYPSSLFNSGAANPTLSCTPGSSAILTGGANGGATIGMSTGTLAPGGSCTVAVNITSHTVGNHHSATGPITTANAGSVAAPGAGATLNVSDLIPLTVTNSYAPPTIVAGQTAIFTVTLANTNGTDVTGIAFTNLYPHSIINATSPAANSCMVGILTATPGGDSLELSGGVIPANGRCTITVGVTGTTAGTYFNKIPQVTTANAGTSIPAGVSLQVVSVGISKSFGTNPITAGSTSLMTITLTNPTGTEMTGAAFTDIYPAGMTNTAAPNAQTSCTATPAPVITAAANGGSLQLSGGRIPANGACTVTVNVTATGTATNRIGVGDLTVTGPTPGSNTVAAEAVLQVHPLHTATKAFIPASIAEGKISRLTITMRNSHTVAATGVSLTDYYPGGLVNASGADAFANNTCGGTMTATTGGATLALTSGTIPANGSCTLEVNVTSANAGIYTNSTGPVTTGNAGTAASASAVLTVLRPPTAAMTFLPVQIGTNGSAVLLVTLTNANASALISGIAFTTNYPAQLANTATPGASTTCTSGSAIVTAQPNGTSLSLAAGTIPANSSCTVSVNVTSAAAGVYSPTTGAITTTNAGSLAAPGAAATLTVALPAPLVNKTFTPGQVSVNEPSLLKVALTNPNGVDIIGLAFNDIYPAGLVNVSAATTTCDGATVTTPTASSLVLSGATIPAGGSCEVAVTIRSTAGGGFTNTINAITSANAGTAGPASAPLIVVLSPPVASKTFTPANIGIDRTSVLTVSLANPNAVAITGASFNDLYPPGLINTAAPNATATCGGTPLVTAAAGGNSLALSGASIPANSSCTVTVNVSSATAGSYPNNTGPISSANAALGTAATATLTVVTPSLTKTFSPATIVSGQASTLTFYIANGSGNPAQAGLGFTDTLPVGLHLTGTATPSQCGGVLSYDTSISPHTITFAGGSLATGAAGCTITTMVSSDDLGSYVNNSANIGDLTGGLTATGADATLMVIPPAALSMDFTPTTMVAGQTSILTISITNGNGNPAQAGLGFTDTLPVGLHLTGTATPSQCGGVLSYDTSTTPHRIHFSGGSLAAGAASCAITAMVTTATPGTFSNGESNLTNLAGGLLAPNLPATLTVIPPAILAKGFSPTIIDAFATSTLTFTIGNGSGNPPQTALAFTDTLPANVSLVGTAISPQCGGTVSYDTSATPHRIHFTGGSLTAGEESCSITTTVTSSVPGSYQNTSANIGDVGGGLVTSGVNAALSVQAPSPSLSKAFFPATVVAGQNSLLAFSITNGTGNLAQSGFSFTDTLPTGLTLAGTAISSQCGGTVTYDTSSTPHKIHFSGGSLTSGQADCVISTTVTAATPGNYANTAANIDNIEGNLDATGVNAALAVIPPAILGKGFSPATIVTGQTAILTFTLANGSGHPAQTGLGFTDTLPAGVTLSGAPNSPQCGGSVTYDTSVAPHKIIFSGGSLTAGQASCSITAIVASVTAGSHVNNSGNLSGITGGLNISGVNAALTVIPPATLTKAFLPVEIGVGRLSNLTFAIQNGSGNPAQAGLGFTNLLPSGINLSGAANSPQCGGSVTYDTSGAPHKIIFSGGSLTAGQASCAIVAPVTSAAPGAYLSGGANVQSLSGGMVNGVTEQTLTVVATTLGKAFSPDTIGVGQTSTLTFTISNGSGNPAQSALGFSENLPAGLSLSGSATASQCGGIVSYTGTNVLNFTAGVLAPGQASCTITAVVTVSSTGSYSTNAAHTSNLAGGLDATGASATLTVVGTTLSKSFTPAVIVAGQTSTLTLTVTNGAGNPAQSGLAFTDTLPSLVTVTAAASSQCGGMVGFSGNVLTFSGGTLPQGTATCNIIATVTSNTAGGYINNDSNISVPPGSPINDAGASATLTVKAAPRLSKAFSPATIATSGISTMTFTIVNGSGNPEQSGLAFTDTLPAGVTLSGTAASSQCGGTVSTAGGNAITLTGGSLSAGTASCTITASVTSSTAGVYLNDSSRISNPGGGLITSEVNATLSVITSVPTLSKAFSPTAIGVGQTLTLTFTINNGSGNLAQSSLGFMDTMPANITIAMAPPASQCNGTVSGTVGSNIISFTGGSLASGIPSCTISVTVTSAAAGSYTNNSTNISNLTGSPNPLNAAGVNATLTVSRPTLSVTFAPTVMGVGQASLLSFTIGNGSGNPAQSGLGFSNTLPPHLTVAAVPVSPQCGGSVTYDAATNRIAFANGILTSGTTSCRIDLTVSSDTSGTYSNSYPANIADLTGALDATGAAATLTVLLPPTASKSFASPMVLVNGTTTLAITLGNANDHTITGVAFTDTFPTSPGPMVVAATANLNNDCNGTVTTPGNNALVLTGGSIAPGESCTVSVNVTAATVGDYTNSTGVIATANAGSGAPATAGITFFLLPNLTVVSQADRSTAKPGDVINYTIQVKNFGGGVAANVLVTDRMSPHAALEVDSFQFSDGVPPSGLLLGDPEFCSSDYPDWNYSPAPSGFDGNVTKWRIYMGGTMNANDANFTIIYRAKVK